jgi:hypothetical protein
MRVRAHGVWSVSVTWQNSRKRRAQINSGFALNGGVASLKRGPLEERPMLIGGTVLKLRRNSRTPGGKLVGTCGLKYWVLGVQRKYYWLRNQLQRPWGALRSWKLKLPLKSRRPISRTIVNSFFLTCLSEGLASAQALCWISAAVVFRKACSGLVK